MSNSIVLMLFWEKVLVVGLNLDLFRTKTLGLQLVNSLVQQIEGQLVFSHQAGARVEIEFMR